MSQLSQYVSTLPNKWLWQMLSSIQVIDDVQLGAIELVTPVLAKTQKLYFYQPHVGKQKPKTSIIAQTSAKAVDSLYARICLVIFSIAII